MNSATHSETYCIKGDIQFDTADMEQLHDFFESYFPTQTHLSESVSIAVAIDHILRVGKEKNNIMRKNLHCEYEKKFPGYISKLVQLFEEAKEQLTKKELNLPNAYEQKLLNYDVECSKGILDYFGEHSIADAIEIPMQQYTLSKQLPHMTTKRKTD